jgi:hypothetical protein
MLGSVSRLSTVLVPIVLCLIVAGVYAAVYVRRAGHPGGALVFVVLATSNTPGNHGYDGQFYYRIASDPLTGRHGLDKPAYRYQRIGYPLLARALALGQQDRIASALVLLNVAAIALGTLFVAWVMLGNGHSALYALPYAVSIGQVACFWRDLAEPLAFALTAAALLAWQRAHPRTSAMLLLAGVFVKEAVLLFIAAALLHLLLRGRLRTVAFFLLVSVLPFVLWQLVLWRIFGQTGLGSTDHPPVLPFGGLAGARTTRQWFLTLPSVVIPALLCLWLLGEGAVHLWREMWAQQDPDSGAVRRAAGAGIAVLSDFPSLALAANLALIIWLPPPSYADLWASTRIALGVVLAALTYPAFARSKVRYPLVILWSCCAPLLWLQ